MLPLPRVAPSLHRRLLVLLPRPDAADPSGRTGRLARSLRASTMEGVTAEVVGACCGGAALTGWALHLGCGPAAVGFLGALPSVAQVVQLPASRLTVRLGPRRVALWTVALSRQLFLPVALLALLPVGPGAARAVLFAAAVLSQVLGMVCNNAWTAWMGELVPGRVRGRYFGRRSAVCTAGGAAAALAAGALLDGVGGARALAVLALVASAAGVASTVLMARQHGGHPRPRPVAGPGGARRAGVLRSRPARRWLAYAVVSGAGSGFIVPFASLYVLRDRAFGFTFLAAYGGVSALARIAAASPLGRALDRAGGPRRVVAASTALLAASPLLWVAAAAGGPWVLLVEAASGGAATAGVGVATLAVPLAIAPADERATWNATFAIAGGVAFAAGACAASPAAALWPGAARLAGPLTVPFLAAAALRACAAAIGLRLVTGRAAGRAG
jgi:MFS family permease